MPESEAQRAERLLLAALSQAGISERNASNQTAPILGGSTTYWQRTHDLIEIVTNHNNLMWGNLFSRIVLTEFSVSALRIFPDDDSAISALVALLNYLTEHCGLLMYDASQRLLLRASRELKQKRHSLRDIAVGQTLTDKLAENAIKNIDNHWKALAGRLAGDRTRGGRDAKLPKEQRDALHVQYDTLHKISRQVKTEYSQVRKTFERQHKVRGHTHRQWQKHWNEYLASKYPKEVIKGFLEIFAHVDEPSAAEVAYTKLANYTGHKRSYLPRLVAESRKTSKP